MKPTKRTQIARLDRVRKIVLAKPRRLNMDYWHSTRWSKNHTPKEEETCGSSHCIAGWLQALSKDKKIRGMYAEEAGAKLCPIAALMFWSPRYVVLEWLKNREYAK